MANNLCPIQINPDDIMENYFVKYTNGMSKDIQAHNIDEAWHLAYKEPYDVLDVIKGR